MVPVLYASAVGEAQTGATKLSANAMLNNRFFI